MINIGNHVKCVLRNSTVVEGIVEEWSDEVVKLHAIDGQSILIIAHPKEDIMLIKLILEVEEDVEEDVEESSPPKKSRPFPQTELQEKFEQTLEEPSNVYDEARNKTLAQLKVDLVKEERRILAEKLREHRPGMSSKTLPNYKYPGAVSELADLGRTTHGHTGTDKKPSSE